MGVQSKSEPQSEFVIFSFENTLKAYTGNNREALKHSYETLLATFNSGEIHYVNGAYKNETETSYILPLRKFKKACATSSLFLSLVANEETVLHLTGEMDARSRRRAFLQPVAQLIADNDETPTADLGYFGEVPEWFARLQAAWSERNGVYFTTLSADHWRKYEELKNNAPEVLKKPNWFAYRKEWLSPQAIATFNAARNLQGA